MLDLPVFGGTEASLRRNPPSFSMTHDHFLIPWAATTNPLLLFTDGAGGWELKEKDSFVHPVHTYNPLVTTLPFMPDVHYGSPVSAHC